MNFILEELSSLKFDISKLEERIRAFEMSSSFESNDTRYLRLIHEKNLLTTNLCQLRLKLCQGIL